MGEYLKKGDNAWSRDSFVIMPTPSAFARQSLLYVQEAGHVRTLDHYTAERKDLDSYLLLFAVAGEGILGYRDRSHLLKPNHAFFINCREYHRYCTSDSAEWEYIWIHLNGKGAEEYYKQFIQFGKPVLRPLESAYMLDKLRELLAVLQLRNIPAELVGSKLLTDLLTHLLLSVYEGPAVQDDLPRVMKQVQRYLDEHYHERITLDSLSSLFGVNRFMLVKSFKKHTGFSPIEYLIKVRITSAKELLKFTDAPVAEIAQCTGISNTSHFINLFKEAAGDTPLAFRKKWRSSVRV